MILITTGGGFLLASTRPVDFLGLVNVLVGTALIAGGTNAFNQYFEREHDAQMARTRKRPLPSGRMSEREAFAFSTIVSVVGITYLFLAVNPLSALVAFATFASYVFVYTPLKRKTNLCTIIGAVPGALPPLIGWAGAASSLGSRAWLLFGVMFLWQLPHFLAISWIYRDDYARAGFRMISNEDRDGGATGRQALLYSLALLTVSILPGLVQLSGLTYLFGAIAAGTALSIASASFAMQRTMRAAKRLFMFSNVYLLVIITLLLVGKVIS
jgi:protoheme IX farnesyltransferase